MLVSRRGIPGSPVNQGPDLVGLVQGEVDLIMQKSGRFFLTERKRMRGGIFEWCIIPCLC